METGTQRSRRDVKYSSYPRILHYARKCAIPKKIIKTAGLTTGYTQNLIIFLWHGHIVSKPLRSSIEAFPRRILAAWRQNDGAMCEAAPIAPPPALFVQRTISFFFFFCHQSSISWVRQPFRCISWKVHTAYLLSSRLRLELPLPGLYPVALGPGNATGLVLVRCPWLVTVQLTHSALIWGHLCGGISCTLAVARGNCSGAPTRGRFPYFVCVAVEEEGERWRSYPPARCWSASRATLHGMSGGK